MLEAGEGRRMWPQREGWGDLDRVRQQQRDLAEAEASKRDAAMAGRGPHPPCPPEGQRSAES